MGCSCSAGASRQASQHAPALTGVMHQHFKEGIHFKSSTARNHHKALRQMIQKTWFFHRQGNSSLCSEMLLLSPDFRGALAVPEKETFCAYSNRGKSHNRISCALAMWSLVGRKYLNSTSFPKPTGMVPAWNHLTNLSLNWRRKNRHWESRMWSSFTPQCQQEQVHRREKSTWSHLLNGN